MVQTILFLISSGFWAYVVFFGSHKFDNPVNGFLAWVIISFITGVIISLGSKSGANPWDDPFF